MNHKVLLLSLLLLPLSLHAADLIIADGETYTVTDSQRELHLKKLVIGNNATIKFASDVTYWDLNADYVEIGRNVLIDGHGMDGANGLAATVITDRAGDCERGKQGNDGKSGERGGNGVDIQMKLAIARFGSMKINIDGGKGGNGGDGGKGQQGGVANNCNPTDGGDGGNAGFGGAGGSGGKLTVVLSAAKQDLNLMALSHQIETSADAGSAGKGGKGGEGGGGSEGQFINQKTLTGDKKWVSGGSKGKTGLAGEAGKPGSEGRVFVGGGELKVMAMEAAKAPVAAPAQSNELEELKAQIRLIQQRLDALEKKQH